MFHHDRVRFYTACSVRPGADQGGENSQDFLIPIAVGEGLWDGPGEELWDGPGEGLWDGPGEGLWDGPGEGLCMGRTG